MISLSASSGLRLAVGRARSKFLKLKQVNLLALSMFSVVLSDAAMGGDLSVTIRDDDGELLENAVVTLTPSFDLDKPYVMRRENQMRQENTLFAPFVLPIGVGESVTFPNFDEFRHHVYSFSAAKRFELRLYGKDETKSIQFDEAGVVALGCNIHDNMLSYIYVSEAPIFAKTDVDGVARFDGLQEGEYTVGAWHPGLKRNAEGTTQVTAVADGAAASFTLALRRVWGAQTAPAEGQY